VKEKNLEITQFWALCSADIYDSAYSNSDCYLNSPKPNSFGSTVNAMPPSASVSSKLRHARIPAREESDPAGSGPNALGSARRRTGTVGRRHGKLPCSLGSRSSPPRVPAQLIMASLYRSKAPGRSFIDSPSVNIIKNRFHVRRGENHAI